MPTKTRNKKPPAELAHVLQDRDTLASPAGREAVLSALRSGSSRLAAEAARAIAEHKPAGFEDALEDAYRRFAAERAAALDPGCVSKEALLAALDAVESSDSRFAVFLPMKRVADSSGSTS